MTALHEPVHKPAKPSFPPPRVVERRKHRRHDMDPHNVVVERWDARKHRAVEFGRLMDLSSGGARIRTRMAVKPEQQIRLRLRLPVYAGISPFLDTSGETLKPKNEWTGWMAVARVRQIKDGEYEVGGRLIDMEDLDRGMLGLYLSTQPLAM